MKENILKIADELKEHLSKKDLKLGYHIVLTGTEKDAAGNISSHIIEVGTFTDADKLYLAKRLEYVVDKNMKNPLVPSNLQNLK